ncbi:hypothetical protein ACIP9X_12090 [Arthrobacter sp. NPDC093125]|uniref:hypothetical protein n=1 Tax=Arthrobacter sp. NPDC093125 TaxID=3363944 RepID=UPI0038077519
MAAAAGGAAGPPGLRRTLAEAPEIDDTHERTLDVWLHGQRIDYRAGRLDPGKDQKLNELLPAWREGRSPRGVRGRRAITDR